MLMMLPRIGALLSTSLLVLSAPILGGSQQSKTTTVTYTATTSGSAQCLDEVNAVREVAGLSNFTQASEPNTLPTPGTGDLQENTEWRKLWQYLTPTQTTKAPSNSEAENPFKDGTYAFKSLTDAQPKCKDTVDSWKGAFKNFTGLPPSKSEANGLYDKQDNASFVALYNPSSSATVDCRVVTCTKKTSTAADELAKAEGDATSEYGYALICKTMPDALADENSAPFT
ncbi:Surface antigen 2, related [Eimeria necatrix]|uniref:Surface antigen 2, related n=1 Tax=Eimeria necatrix TaxID=51315 RepID=U6MPD6_9EIME|nr:Surface antigen 2, related [Eimeria necatrix]CDJ64349.1 Surface antigen 2, related [Eimeria necatrix]